ncbi:hypothetical protein GCM10022197_17280 [Microlunatus spumicola]|uniref:Uncharacterized protein n=1 Tax=Microlunatus spumicola TaxID=81499 RepID=A0ABP6X6D0_9ACTN
MTVQAEAGSGRAGLEGTEADRAAATGEHAEADRWWVDARPFRAHLQHLMGVGRLDVPEVAVVLGLSTRAVRHLLEGRSGRVPRRISPPTARRLLLVRVDDVRELRWRVAPAAPARTSLDLLRAEGWSIADVAFAVGSALDELVALDDATHCNRLLAVRLVGLARRLPGTRDDQDLDEVAAAA